METIFMDFYNINCWNIFENQSRVLRYAKQFKQKILKLEHV
jgi:hypothetical protein